MLLDTGNLLLVSFFYIVIRKYADFNLLPCTLNGITVLGMKEVPHVQQSSSRAKHLLHLHALSIKYPYIQPLSLQVRKTSMTFLCHQIQTLWIIRTCGACSIGS